MNDDEITALATDLRALRARWGEAAARAALADNAALSPDQRARIEALVFSAPASPAPADIGVSGDAETVQQLNVAAGGHVGQVVARQEHHYHAGSADLPQRRARYLEYLAAQQDALPLQGLAERPDRGDALALHHVYTLLAVGEKVELACIAQDQPSPYFRDGQVPLKSPDHKDTYGQLLGDAYGAAVAQWNLGRSLLRMGRRESAFTLLEACANYLRQIGHVDAPRRHAQVAKLYAHYYPADWDDQE